VVLLIALQAKKFAFPKIILFMPLKIRSARFWSRSWRTVCALCIFCWTQCAALTRPN